MELATVADVEMRLGRTLTTSEAELADPGLIEEASALVEAHLNYVYTEDDTIPSTVAIVVSRMVARVLKQEASGGVVPGVQQRSTTAGPFAQQSTFVAGASSGGPWLAASDKQMLKPHRVGGGLIGVQQTTGRTGKYLREV